MSPVAAANGDKTKCYVGAVHGSSCVLCFLRLSLVILNLSEDQAELNGTNMKKNGGNQKGPILCHDTAWKESMTDKQCKPVRKLI